jgi:DNA polymerase delta subunit 2
MLTRAYTEHQPKFQRFLPDIVDPSCAAASSGGGTTTTTPYGRQYSHVYHERLSRLAPVIWKRIETIDPCHDIPNHNKVNRILELLEDVESTVVGTIIRVMVEATDDNSDEYFLEDDSGRVALEFPNDTMADDLDVIMGVVVGLTGTVGIDGVFRVRRIVTAHSVRTVVLPNANLTSLSSSSHSHPNRQIMLLSGLACGSSQSSSLSRSMLLAYLHGAFGHAAEQVSQVIIAGGSIAAHASTTIRHKNNEPSSSSSMSTLQGCYELDGFLAQCTEVGIPVTLIPGKDDPTTAAWPQRPWHSSLLPRSTTSLLTRSTNPYVGRMEHVTLIGTDGRNIPGLVPKKNNKNNTDETTTTTLDALQNIVKFGHVCPSAPDSVPAVPSGDPFVLDDDTTTTMTTTTTPQKILFAGNASTFASRLVVIDAKHGNNDEDDDMQEEDGDHNPKQPPPKYCRLIAIPKFEETGQAVLVNIDTLQVHVLKFQPGQEQP